MSEKIVNLENISKKYDNVVALDHVSVSIPAAAIIGFIGADGAGKSTLMKIILTLETADNGSGTVLGSSIETEKRAIRRHIGYMPEIFSLYTDLSVEENLKFFFQIYKIPKSQYNEKMEMLYGFNRLENFKSTLAGHLSGGMKQKLALSCALMHDPKILVLDEPTTGVDPVSRAEFWKMLNQLKSEGKTILISTPYLDEAMQCDYIYLFHQGKILKQGLPAQIISDYEIPFYQIETRDPIPAMKKLQRSQITARFYLIGDTIHCAMRTKAEPSLQGIKKIAGDEISIKKIPPTLEDIFLDLLERSGEINDVK
ncbi:MAG: ABC transporter ATP-binding protein [Calditrichaeota bacterium]|nr:ABC transporter ATP-binding protein [Calditrichota bacterium]